MKNKEVFLLVGLVLSAAALAGCKEVSRFAWAAESRGFSASGWPAAPAGLDAKRRSASHGLARYLSGLLAEGKGDFSFAEAEYLRARQSDPESVLILLHLGTVSMKGNDIPKAVGFFETASRLDPADPRPRFLLGILYTSQQRFEEAANEYSKVLAQDPGDLGALSSLADLYLLQEKLQEALKVYERLLEERPDSPVIHFNVGVLCAKANQWPEAAQHLRRAVELDPANTRLIHYLAQISYRMGDLDEAAEWLTRYLSFKPREADGYLELGTLRIEQGQWQEAVRLFKTALELPDDEESPAELWLALGRAYQAGGDLEASEAAYRNALKISPDQPDALNGLGYLYAEWEVHLEEAVRLITRALSQDPQNGAYLDSLGWAAFKSGRLQEALRFLKEASSRMPDPEVFYHLGQVYSSLGDLKGAKAAWEQGLALKQQDPEVTRRLKSSLKGHNRKSKGKVRSF